MSQEHMTQNFSQGGFTQDSFFYKYRWDLCRLYFRWFIKTCKREILNKWVKQATLRRAWAKDSARACPKECIQVKESWDSHKIFQIFHSMIQASSKIIFYWNPTRNSLTHIFELKKRLGTTVSIGRSISGSWLFCLSRSRRQRHWLLPILTSTNFIR